MAISPIVLSFFVLFLILEVNNLLRKGPPCFPSGRKPDVPSFVLSLMLHHSINVSSLVQLALNTELKQVDVVANRRWSRKIITVGEYTFSLSVPPLCAEA